jgi:3-oxoacyl-[acyl-carrier-protein] synthase II
MREIDIAIEGAAWITVSGIGSLNSDKDFLMPSGNLPELRKEMLTTSPEQRWGRLDDYSKAGLIAASMAVEDSNIETTDSDLTTGIVVSTVTGCVDVDHKYYQTVLPEQGLLASPNLFAYTLPNCMLGEVSIKYGFTGPAMVVSQITPNMLNGITTGAELLNYGLCDRVIAGYCNLDFNTDFVDSKCKPGAVFLVMKKTEKKIVTLAYNGVKLLYNGNEMSDLVDLIEKLIQNRFVE